MKTQEEYQNIAQEFANLALEKYGDRVDTIILFGSAARGEAREDSDIDILVVGDVTLDELLDVSVPLLLQHGKHISAHDMEKSRFKRLVDQGYSFISNVLNDGVVLFESKNPPAY
ncbi:MAG: Nucleotidyltransferase domain protein [Methanobacterium sp. PtaB.Bin024]|jgi:predicted nucleotidyltransferase|nr:MAG: Nucleotidyltransferase domain protein [Methanobacterium sp. PtaB.Bin024]